ncbi:MAG: RNA polymerase sigma factor [Dethiobacteria bacterium]
MPAKEHVEEEILLKESKIELYRRLQNLNEKTREVIYLRLTGDLSFREIGDILNRTETWARVTFYRGKQKLLKGGAV